MWRPGKKKVTIFLFSRAIKKTLFEAGSLRTSQVFEHGHQGRPVDAMNHAKGATDRLVRN